MIDGIAKAQLAVIDADGENSRYAAELIVMLRCANPTPMLQAAAHDCWKKLTFLNSLAMIYPDLNSEYMSRCYATIFLRGAVLHQLALHLKLNRLIDSEARQAIATMWVNAEARSPGSSRRLIEAALDAVRHMVDLETVSPQGNA